MSAEAPDGASVGRAGHAGPDTRDALTEPASAREPGPDGSGIPAEALALARRVAEQLRTVAGVVAVALGGSVARGRGRPDSDLDLGLYYRAHRPLDIAALDRVASELDDRRAPGLVTAHGGWGPWIDGGGWLVIEGRRVDVIYRDLDRVEAILAECAAGALSVHYQPGHPHAFLSPMYVGEVHHARILLDPRNDLAAVQARTSPYPPALRAATIRRFLWEAEFALLTSEKAAARGDVFQVAGSLFRSVACLAQALFALNERYCLNEKGATDEIARMARRPADWAARVADALGAPGRTAGELLASHAAVAILVRDVRALCAAEGFAAAT